MNEIDELKNDISETLINYVKDISFILTMLVLIFN